jgi:hypothetical protein
MLPRTQARSRSRGNSDLIDIASGIRDLKDEGASIPGLCILLDVCGGNNISGDVKLQCVGPDSARMHSQFHPDVRRKRRKAKLSSS